jgi:hypothetical protein
MGKVAPAMIQIRQDNGSVIQVPQDGHFVELVNDVDGTIMLAFFQPKPGMVVQVEPGTRTAINYEGMFQAQGVKFSAKQVKL